MTTPGYGSISSGIRDNHNRGTVGDFLKLTIKSGSDLSIVSAYFTIYAFSALQKELLGIKSLRFLFGEPRFIRSLDPDKTDKKAFNIEDATLVLSGERLKQRREARECAEWMSNPNVQIRSIKQVNLLHGKMYHVSHNGSTTAILGSSNFTVRGLGLGESGNNIELNLEVSDKRDLEDLRSWFDEIWNNTSLVEDVKAEILEYLNQLYQNHSPEFIYYKTLFHVFQKYLASQAESDLLTEKTQLIDTHIWNALFEFQKDGVKGAINKILAYNGCIMADSVGLGKTYEALAVIKYFELRNDKVLVLCPKKLRENWTVYLASNNSELNPFVDDRFGYTVLSHTDLSRDSGYSGDTNLETLNWGNYDLVVIDESHNFRNNNQGKKDEEGQTIKRSRYERLMEDIVKQGRNTKVLLLSATPVNNDLNDLINQISFLTQDRDNAFRESMGINSIKKTLSDAQRVFGKWSEQQEKHSSELLAKLSSAFFKLLDTITIARSRKHIQTYYPETLAQLGGFPTRLKPISIFPDVDTEGMFMSYEMLNREISNYRLALFNPSAYVLPEFKAVYEQTRVRNFRQSTREHFLIGMMKVNFLKRLESSIHSFKLTMERTIQKIGALEQRIQDFKTFQQERPELDFAGLELEDLGDEEFRDVVQVGENFTFQLAHLDLETWLKDLKKDKQQLNILCISARDVSPERDAKLAGLKELVRQKVEHPTINQDGVPNRKVLVFTAFADTATYLYVNLQQWATDELGIQIALVTGSGGENRATFGRTDFNHILTNFSPLAKRRAQMPGLPQEGEIDLLIATDCISEGQNLQDCDYLVNYDIHWNPVRIIQRFGRIDRIGSRSQTVQLVNFWPTEDLNAYINLKGRVEARMALVDLTATGDDNLLEEELKSVVETDLHFRDQQLLKLKDEVLDLEDLDESINLTEFTLDDFRIDLSNYMESNRKVLNDAPLGLYALVPPLSELSTVAAPGVIFCLCQKGESQDAEVINPLQPYFLVYVRHDGEVRFKFFQPKQLLDLYRKFCIGKTTPYEELCRLFDAETRDGSEMEVYGTLLGKAIASITTSFQSRNAMQLQTGRGGLLVGQKQQATKTEDFELITWLVIKAHE